MSLIRTLAEFNEQFAHSDAPRIGDFDALLEGLKREFGEPRTDIAVQLLTAGDAARCAARQPISRTASTPNR
jgi:hypothetical protein